MTQSGKTMDLIAVGRAGIDLYGQQVGGRLEDMASFAKYIGGSPTNTAIGAARLGLTSGLITRVGADHIGRFISEQLEREGVDTSGVLADLDRLTGLVILGIRDRERFPLIFYRENCADMALTIADLDRGWIEKAGAVLINGTHLSRDAVFDASMAAAHWCKAAGGKVVFDIDYRPVLWGLTDKDAGENRFVPRRERDAAAAGGGAGLRPDRRHRRGVSHPRRIDRHDRGAPKGSGAQRRIACLQTRAAWLCGIRRRHSGQSG
jgi:5-dehydro-2-deoxygluconokinase